MALLFQMPSLNALTDQAWESFSLHCAPIEEQVEQALKLCGGRQLATYQTAVLCAALHPDLYQREHWRDVADYGKERAWDRSQMQ